MSRTTQAGSRETRRQLVPGAWTLLVLGPGTLRVEHVGASGEVVLGRDPGCQVQLDHARVSRRHARISLGRPCLVEDLGSRNGTKVAGSTLPTGATVELAPGESFSVGPFTCTLLAEAAADVEGSSSMVIDDPSPVTPPALLTTLAESPLTVLVLGETGVGKELLAETLHRLSGRSGRLVRLNCASLPADLMESELFGHERGAFTGAVTSKKGLLEAAAGGTVFLDEIGELPLVLQAKLLRAMEAREILRVGSTEPIAVDVRFVAATNRDLPAQIAAGAFRLDLYYRLAVLTLTIAPLRDRKSRLPALATDLVRAAAARSGAAVPSLTPSAMAKLQAHRWPGNVRELRNVLERAVLLARGSDLDARHILFDPAPALGPAAPLPATEPPAGMTGPARPSAPTPAPASAGDTTERQRIIDALAACAGNQTRAAKLLGMSRSTLATKLALLGVPRPQRP